MLKLLVCQALYCFIFKISVRIEPSQRQGGINNWVTTACNPTKRWQPHACISSECIKTKHSKPLLFVPLMVIWAKYKTTVHHQGRLKSLWAGKGRHARCSSPSRKEENCHEIHSKCNMFPNRTLKGIKEKIQLCGKYKETNLNLTSCPFYLPTLSNYFKKIRHLKKLFS